MVKTKPIIVNKTPETIEPAIDPILEGVSTEQPSIPTITTEPEITMVDIISGDGRELEVSIGSQSWKGKIISVPSNLEADIRRILEEGHYFIK